MNDDLKRLCGVLADYEPIFDSYGWRSEDIVRAVLIALREPSAAMVDVGGGIDDGRYHSAGFVGDDQAKQAFTAMIDAILAEPATA